MSAVQINLPGVSSGFTSITPPSPSRIDATWNWGAVWEGAIIGVIKNKTNAIAAESLVINILLFLRRRPRKSDAAEPLSVYLYLDLFSVVGEQRHTTSGEVRHIIRRSFAFGGCESGIQI